MDYHGKVCVVTGGALGIGRCLVGEFARAGASVAFIDREQQAGEAWALELAGSGARVLFFPGDVGREADLKAFASRVAADFGRVDCLVNNACLSHGGILAPCGYDDFNEVLRIGVTAPYYLTLALLPYFAPGAAVVNIASTRAAMSQPDTESYTAAKGGIAALTHALAVSLAGRVRVCAVSPGWIDTGAWHDPGYLPSYTAADTAQHPSGRVGDPMDIARAVMFLCDGENSFINGENLTVDGGMTRLMIYSGDHGWEYRP